MPDGRAPTVACVTGMHRSGTSFAAHALHALGVSFGDAEFLMPPGPDNEAGYWENRAIKELDDDLLAQLGGSWDRPPVLPMGWHTDPSLEEFRARAADVIDASFGPPSARTAPIGWKDPRLSLLLPFWRTVCPITGTVIIVRHPTEVAASLAKRDGLDSTSAHLLWLRYLLAACANDPNHLIVRHDVLLSDVAATLDALATHFALPAPDTEAIEAVERHLDPSLHHHRAASLPDVEEGEPNPVAALARAVWNGGSVSIDLLETPALGTTLQRGLQEGWLRPPADTEALDQARARNVDLTDLLRRRTRRRVQLQGSSSPPPELPL